MNINFKIPNRSNIFPEKHNKIIKHACRPLFAAARYSSFPSLIVETLPFSSYSRYLSQPPFDIRRFHRYLLQHYRYLSHPPLFVATTVSIFVVTTVKKCKDQ